MPFSRSRSPESSTRSVISWLARKAPVWRSMASTNVVLPWSTWATMATLRRSSRTDMGLTRLVAGWTPQPEDARMRLGLGLPLAPTLILGFRSGTSDS